MKKILFVSNISKKLTNFSIPSIEAAKEVGYDFHMAANLKDFKEINKSHEIKLHHLDISRNPFNIKNFKAYKQMNNLLKKENFDAIHCNTPMGGILGRICGKKANVQKVIYTAHGFHFYKGASPIKSFLFKSIEKFLASYTDAIITINNEDYEAAKKFHLRKKGEVYFIPGVGVNTQEYNNDNINKFEFKQSLGLHEDAIIFVAMGDLIARKNYKTSIEAISLASNPKINLLICGAGPELSELKKYAITKNVEKQIHFLGYRSDIKEILSVSDVFLFTTFQEGLPRSMMEAMSSGLPCIASKIRGNVDLIENGEGGYLVAPGNSKGFSEAINVLSRDATLRNTMGKNNLANVKKYDVANIKKEMKKIYSNELI